MVYVQTDFKFLRYLAIWYKVTNFTNILKQTSKFKSRWFTHLYIDIDILYDNIQYIVQPQRDKKKLKKSIINISFLTTMDQLNPEEGIYNNRERRRSSVVSDTHMEEVRFICNISYLKYIFY